MLNSLLQKYSFILSFVFLLFSSSALAFELGVSPPELVFEGFEGNRLCQFVKIYEGRGREIEFDLLFSDVESEKKETNQFFILAKDKRIDWSIEKGYSDSNRDIYSFCVSAKDDGIYRALLIVSAKDEIASIGVWTDIFIDKDIIGKRNNSLIALGLLVFSALEVGVLMFIFYNKKVLKYRRKKH